MVVLKLFRTLAKYSCIKPVPVASNTPINLGLFELFKVETK